MKWIISRQLPDSPPPQQGASDPISGLTGLCVYLFYPNLFPSQINIISPPKPTVMPPKPETTRLWCWIPYFSIRLGIISWGGRIKFSSWLETFWRGKWNCFHIGKSFGMWHRSCRDVSNRMKLDPTIKEPVKKIHSSKRTRSSMFCNSVRME